MRSAGEGATGIRSGESAAVPEERIRAVRDVPPDPRGDYVLYWMIACRRLGWSHALDRCIELCRDLRRPLLVLEPLGLSYPHASERHHRAILDGMREHRAELAGTGIGYHPWVESERGAGRGLLAALAERACAVVTDEWPGFIAPGLVEAAGRVAPVRLEAVDGCGLLPMRAPGRAFTAAYHFRRWLQRELPARLGSFPAPDPLARADLPPFAGLPADVVSRWPAAAAELLDGRRSLARLPLDHGVAACGWAGGTGAGRARLERFLDDGLPRYADERNDPDADAVSGLSAYLHHGHLSAHEIFRALTEREGWTPLRIAEPNDGRRAGWWGMSASAEAFLDQLVTWRELGYGWCLHDPDFSSYDSLPGWARQTLEAHASDERPWTYDREQLEQARTHDDIWNAAQRQLVRAGTIHGYLRMLWGKKILEWTPDPRTALRTMIELNDRWALDGRDPNSYSGITWVMGRFDRGWPERAVFGKVRSMSSDATRRKVELGRYLERWSA